MVQFKLLLEAQNRVRQISVDWSGKTAKNPL